MIKVQFHEYRYDWRTGKDNEYASHFAVGETKAKAFERIYISYIRPNRYCNDVSFKLDDPEQDKRFKEWKKHSVTMEMFYGNTTVD